ARDAARALVIAPDAAETGTNALLLRPPDLLRPRFGPDSFPRHLALAAAAGVEAVIYRSPTLAHDVDLPVDLAEMAAA
ncbi:MAG: 2-phospho-L-lactate guanylyltransferase, partial [Caldilineales bacterium]|nr:2-phospho-L-lactate guanylyltransferase [Caldilineales bacterium]